MLLLTFMTRVLTQKLYEYLERKKARDSLQKPALPLLDGAWGRKVLSESVNDKKASTNFTQHLLERNSPQLCKEKSLCSAQLPASWSVASENRTTMI